MLCPCGRTLPTTLVVDKKNDPFIASSSPHAPHPYLYLRSSFYSFFALFFIYFFPLFVMPPHDPSCSACSSNSAAFNCVGFVAGISLTFIWVLVRLSASAPVEHLQCIPLQERAKHGTANYAMSCPARRLINPNKTLKTT